MQFDALWAKSQRQDMVSFMPIRAHLIDVGAAAEEIYLRQSEVRRNVLMEAFGLDDNGTRRIVGYLAALHDIGKATPWFQAKWNPGYEVAKRSGFRFPRGLTFGVRSAIRHEVHSHVIVRRILSGHNFLPQHVDLILDAVVFHHGRYPLPRTLWDAEVALADTLREHPEWGSAHADLNGELVRLFPIQSLGDVAVSNVAAINLTGIVSAADWIGSSLGYERHIGSSEDWFRTRREEVTARLDQLHWKNMPFVPVSGYSECFQPKASEKSTQFQPRPLQQKLAQATEHLNKPSLIIVESPMGEGKTEAALYAAASLMNRIGHEGVYVALPTMATANQMYERVRRFLENTVGRENKALLQLLHGGTILNDSFTELLTRSNTEQSEDVSDAVAASSWFIGSKQGFLTQYAVGTIDQALHGVLNVKHWFMRLHGLTNKVVILDEVHAYDAYTTGLIVQLVRWLSQLRCTVIVMSATLPSKIRQKLEEAYVPALSEPTNQVENVPYPRLTICASSVRCTEHVPASSQPSINVTHVASELDSIADTLVEKASSGSCVVAIMNTVGRAQKLYSALQGRGVELGLFHARMPGTWRAEREQSVIDLYGAEGQRPTSAILIATQVVEQSLDVDFDVMYTDLAPVDLLLQRIGRLHRHGWRKRVAKPLVLIGGTEEMTGQTAGRSFGIGTVYDTFPVLQTAALLAGKNRLSLPDDIDVLVQSAYGDTDLTTETIQASEVHRTRTIYDEKVEWLTSSMRANRIIPPDGTSPLNSYVGTSADEDVGPGGQTRLSGPSVNVFPLLTERSVQLTLDGRVFDPKHRDSAIAARRSAFSISDPAIVAAILTAGVESTESPVLCGHHRLVFEGGRCRIGSHTVVLDRDLGVIYERNQH